MITRNTAQSIIIVIINRDNRIQKIYFILSENSLIKIRSYFWIVDTPNRHFYLLFLFYYHDPSWNTRKRISSTWSSKKKYNIQFDAIKRTSSNFIYYFNRKHTSYYTGITTCNNIWGQTLFHFLINQK